MPLSPVNLGIALLQKHDPWFHCPTRQKDTEEFRVLMELEELYLLVGHLHSAAPHPDEVLSAVAGAFALQFNQVFRAYSPSWVPRACFELTWIKLVDFGATPSTSHQMPMLAKEFIDSIDRTCVLILRDIVMDLFHPEETMVATV